MSTDTPMAEWTGCVHCGQTLPHEGTSWQESYRCQLFQRIAEQAWDEAVQAVAWALDQGASRPIDALTYAQRNNRYKAQHRQDDT